MRFQDHACFSNYTTHLNRRDFLLSDASRLSIGISEGLDCTVVLYQNFLLGERLCDIQTNLLKYKLVYIKNRRYGYFFLQLPHFLLPCSRLSSTEV